MIIPQGIQRHLLVCSVWVDPQNHTKNIWFLESIWMSRDSRHLLPTYLELQTTILFRLVWWFPTISYLVGGFKPFEKHESKWESSPNRGENKTCLKPPPSFVLKIWFIIPLKQTIYKMLVNPVLSVVTFLSTSFLFTSHPQVNRSSPNSTLQATWWERLELYWPLPRSLGKMSPRIRFPWENPHIFTGP